MYNSLKFKITFSFIFLTLFLFAQSEESFTISGFVLESESEEPLIASQVYVPVINKGAISDENGFFSLILPKGNHNFEVSYIGMSPLEQMVNLVSDTSLTFYLSEGGLELKEVVVVGKSENSAIPTNTVSVKKIVELPTVLGEPDVLKVVQLLPGVSSSSETGVSFSVRGGSSSQNIILLDDAPVYNPSHLLGIVSAFNPYTIKSVDFYKNTIPARFQAGASSVTSIYTKEGNKNTYGGEIGIGILGARVAFEGPIIKDKVSFTSSYRKSILPDVLSKVSDNGDTRITYYDLNTKVSWSINKNNKLFLSYYRGKDAFIANDDGGFQWTNNTVTLTGTSVLSKKLFLRNTLAYSHFNTGFSSIIDSLENGTRQTISSLTLRNVFKWYQNNTRKLTFGTTADYQGYLPFNIFEKVEGVETTSFDFSAREVAFEFSPFIDLTQEIGNKIQLYVGIRTPVYHWLPTEEERIYLNFETDEIDTLFQQSKTYFKFEPRLSLSYDVSKNQSIQVGYQRINQFRQNFIPGGVFSIASFWKPASNLVLPQTVDQFQMQYNLSTSKYSFVLGGYYKNITNISDFIDGSYIFPSNASFGESFIGLIEIGTILNTGRGDSKGLEFNVKKLTGKFTGELSYTLAKSSMKIDGINEDQWYPTLFDRRHDLALTVSYALSKRSKFVALFSYNSGQPVNLPNTSYTINGGDFQRLSNKNSTLKPDYHRLDLSFIREGKERRFIESKWVFSVVNVYNQFNPTFFRFDNGNLVATNLVPILPSISYQLKFKVKKHTSKDEK